MPYTCFVKGCLQTFEDSQELRLHILTHKDRTYICPKCHRTYSDNSKLRRHFLIHSGEKPFKCSYCGKCFSLDYNLTIHLRIHTGEKPYACSYPDCRERFTQQANVKAHITSFHQNKNARNQIKRQYKRRMTQPTDQHSNQQSLIQNNGLEI